MEVINVPRDAKSYNPTGEVSLKNKVPTHTDKGDKPVQTAVVCEPWREASPGSNAARNPGLQPPDL